MTPSLWETFSKPSFRYVKIFWGYSPRSHVSRASQVWKHTNQRRSPEKSMIPTVQSGGFFFMNNSSKNPPENWESAFAKSDVFFKEDPSSLLVFGKEIMTILSLFMIYLSGKKTNQKIESVKSWVDFFVKATPPSIQHLHPWKLMVGRRSGFLLKWSRFSGKLGVLGGSPELASS